MSTSSSNSSYNFSSLRSKPSTGSRLSDIIGSGGGKGSSRPSTGSSGINVTLNEEVSKIRKTLIQEGIVRPKELDHIESLVGPDEPDFLKTIVDVFTTDTLLNVTAIEEAFVKNPMDEDAIEENLQEIEAACNCMGATTVCTKVELLRSLHEENDWIDIKGACEDVKSALEAFKVMMEEYIQAVDKAKQVKGKAKKMEVI